MNQPRHNSPILVLHSKQLLSFIRGIFMNNSLDYPFEAIRCQSEVAQSCLETPVTQTASPGLSVGPGSNQDPSLCPLGCLIKVSERSAHPSPKPWHFSQESAGVGLKPKHASQPSRCACNTFICYWKQGVAGGVWVTLGKSQAL